MDFVNFIKKYSREIAIAILALLVGIFLCTTCAGKRENEYLQHNIKALTDSVQVVTLNNGDLMFEKQSLILEKSELENYLDISKKEVRELEKKLNSSLVYISQLKGQVKIDTVICTDTVYRTINSELQVDFAFNDKWTSLNGNTIIKDNTSSKTTITNLKFDVPLTLGISDEYKFFVTSDNPHVSFSEINSAAFAEKVKKKRWGTGPTLSIGIYGGYDFIERRASIGFGGLIGWSIHYDLLQW